MSYVIEIDMSLSPWIENFGFDESDLKTRIVEV